MYICAFFTFSYTYWKLILRLTFTHTKQCFGQAPSNSFPKLWCFAEDCSVWNPFPAAAVPPLDTALAHVSNAFPLLNSQRSTLHGKLLWQPCLSVLQLFRVEFALAFHEKRRNKNYFNIAWLKQLMWGRWNVIWLTPSTEIMAFGIPLPCVSFTMPLMPRWTCWEDKRKINIT